VIALDHRVERWVVSHRGEPFDWIFVRLSRLGNWGLVWFVLALVGALAWRRPAVIPWTVAAYLVADGLASLLKDIVGRARPVDHPLVTPLHTGSFPSGHATTSFACAATLARFAPRTAAVLLYVLAALIAYSRVYVGVHWPLDVLAGAVLGLLVARALRMLRAALRRSLQARRAG